MILLHKIVDDRSCHACGTKSSLDTHGWKQWHVNKPTKLFLCHKCKCKYIYNPRRDKAARKIENAIYNPMKINFLGARLWLGWNPRKGQCTWCKRKVGDPFITTRGKRSNLKLTQMHHEFYLPCMRWACMIELCVPCHNTTKTITRKKVSRYYSDKTLRIKTKKGGIQARFPTDALLVTTNL